MKMIETFVRKKIVSLYLYVGSIELSCVWPCDFQIWIGQIVMKMRSNVAVGSFNDSHSLLVSFSFRMQTYKYYILIILKSGSFGPQLYFIRSSHKDPDI